MIHNYIEQIMTTSRTLSVAFLAALFALASCDKSDIGVGVGNASRITDHPVRLVTNIE